MDEPQAANTGVEFAGTGQLRCAAAERPHQSPVGIDAEKAAGRQHGHHDADKETAKEQLIANRPSLDHA